MLFAKILLAPYTSIHIQYSMQVYDVLRPDLDSPQDSRKVSPGIIQKNKTDEVIEGGKFIPFGF